MSRDFGKTAMIDKWIKEMEEHGKTVLKTSDIDPDKELKGKEFDWVSYHLWLYGHYPE